MTDIDFKEKTKTLIDSLKSISANYGLGNDGNEFKIITQDEMKQNIGALTKIYEKTKELNRQNNLLKDKYGSDPKYARIHKRLVEKGTISQKESHIFEALRSVKHDADLKVLQNTRLLDNESYFSTQMMGLVIDRFKNKNNINLNAESSKYINNLVVNEYINEFYGRAV